MRPKSIKPKKQRKYHLSLFGHESHKVLSSNLSADLRKKQGFRSLPIHVGDSVIIVRGEMKGKKGKVSRVDTRTQRVFVDKVVKRKTDNTEIPFPIHPSNLVITNINKKDKRRQQLILRRVPDQERKEEMLSIFAEEEEEDVIDLDEEQDADTPADEESEDDFELVEDEDEPEGEDDDEEEDDDA